MSRGESHRNAKPPGLERATTEPAVPAGTDTRRLDRGVRKELRSLPADLAETVAGHLLLAGDLLADDPEAAYGHAEAARRRAARLAIVREAAAETAYAAGRYDTALGEYRALRRMTGRGEYQPVMADCERALGKTDAALRLIREADEQALPAPSRIELRIVEAGIRSDLGQLAEAARLLQATVSEIDDPGAGTKSDTPGRSAGRSAADRPEAHRRATERQAAAARLHYALGDVLLAQQRADQARNAFARAAGLDVSGAIDAAERVDELDGLVLELDDSPAEAPAPQDDSPHDAES